MKEIWKNITLYKNMFADKYLVSNLGRVKSLHKSEKILKPSRIKNKYLNINLCKKGLQKTAKIHVLVAHEFLGPRPEGLEINHIDGNKLNNNVNNLEYCTRSENHKHAYDLGIKPIPYVPGEKCGTSKLTKKQVDKIRNLYKTKKITQQELGVEFGVSQMLISYIVRNLAWRE